MCQEDQGEMSRRCMKDAQDCRFDDLQNVEYPQMSEY